MNKVLKITLISIFTILLLTTVIFTYTILNKSSIYEGVKIEDIYVGGISKLDAEKKLKNRLNEELQNREILLVAEDYSRNIKYSELDIKNDYEKSVNEAYKIGRNGNIFTRLKEIYNARVNGEDIKLEIIKNDEKIKQITNEVNSQIFREKKEATITYSNGEFIVTDEAIGKSVNTDELEKKIEASIENVASIDIPINLDKPAATKELLSQVKEEIGVYTTEFTMNDQNRVFNIQRSSNSIDNKVILPGETFSFNNTTGPRSLSAGYKEATVIMNGEFVPGEGGGVCQVSSTLYNTVLNSGITIVERHTHSLPISYVPPGKDATVAYDVLDLKFKNNYSAPVYIKSYVSGNKLTIKLYGNRNARP